MLMPKRTKHRKMFRPRNTAGKAQRGTTVVFGEYGLQATEQAWITSRQIEASRRAITNYLKRGGKVWIRIFPDKSITQKPAETRMGSGKGSPEYWIAVVKPGRIMFEIAGVPEDRAAEALRRAAMKMPIKCKVVSRPVGAAAYVPQNAAKLEAAAAAAAEAEAGTVVEEVVEAIASMEEGQE